MKLFQKIKQLSNPYTLHLNSEPIISLCQYKNANDESKFSVLADEQIGGISKGVIFHNKEEKATTFLGEIAIDKRKQLENLPYCGIVQTFTKSINISRFSKMLLKMRTDGQIYKVRIRINSSYDFGQHEAYAFIVDTSQEWNTYTIPFNNFYHQGFDKETQKLNSSNEGLQLYSFEILRESKQNEKIAFQIQEFLLSDIQLTQQEVDFERPIFYKYNQPQDKIDTGKDKFNPVNNNNGSVMKQNSKTINNFYE